MSHTLSEPAPLAASLDSAPPLRHRWARWPKRVLFFLLFLWLADLGISFLVRHTRLQHKLTARLESVFGRPVQVGRYDFSLWGGPTLEAQSVTFSEDPRFGYEYFLYAESLTVRLRWQSLLRGHIELGTISLTRPSLNIVRNSAGDWNIAEWLPKPSGNFSSPGASGSSPSPPSTTVRFGRLEVNSGRINFKRADEKLPFALVSVNGYIQPDGPGRWSMNLEAVPTRAAVVVQQAGTIYVAGHVGGTSSRLRPAVLDLLWGDASLSDVLRLARGYDFGIRGNLALIVHAQTEEDTWVLQEHAEFRGLHRWDLAFRPDNPSVNVTAKTTLYPLASSLSITDASIEAPHSFARALANFSWGPPTIALPHAKVLPAPPPVQIELLQSQFALSDVLAWIRAFHSQVAPDAILRGFGGLRARFSGWPLNLVSASGVIDGANLSSALLPVPVHLSRVQFLFDHDRFLLSPSTISYAASDNPSSTPPDVLSAGSLHVETLAGPASSEFPTYHLFGNLPQVRDLVATAGVLGWNISRGWDLAGPVRCDLRWQGAKFPWQTEPVGTIDWGGEPAGASLLTPFLNQPVTQIRARADLKPGARHIALSSADAFGSHWTGTFDHHDGGPGWQFALAADHLATSDIDRWLNPRWRQSFLDRMLPFLNSSSPSGGVPENLSAAGRIAVDQFTLAPYTLHHLLGDLKIGGRHIQFSGANAQFYAGTLDGSLDAQLTAVPAYSINLDYSHIDIAALLAASPTLANQFAGSASGDFATHFPRRQSRRLALLPRMRWSRAHRRCGAAIHQPPGIPARYAPAPRRQLLPPGFR